MPFSPVVKIFGSEETRFDCVKKAPRPISSSSRISDDATGQLGFGR